jgi:hypothetical protein
VVDAPRREALGDAARERCIARYDTRTNTRALAHLMRSVAR